MGGDGAMNDNDYSYNDNLAEANTSELGPGGIELILPSLAEDIASSAADPEDALDLCHDAAQAENLDDDQFLALVRLVEDMNDWELPDMGEDF